MRLDLSDQHIIDWLSQFDLSDQPIASQLLSNLTIVGADEQNDGLRSKILELAEQNEGPIALYAERHVRRQGGVPDRLFKETRRLPRRSFGAGPAPVPSGRAYARETGSEGLIATLITGIARSLPNIFLDHPGPDQLRTRCARKFVIVTDFLGSGVRTRDNLEAVWKARTLKSWHSFGWIRFHVVAYASTEAGARIVRAHRSKPSVHLCLGCPTVNDLESNTRKGIEALCNRYGPRPKSDKETSLGFGNAGALLAFDHGMPNNAPLLLHRKAKKWTPLFPGRSTVLLGSARRVSAQREEIRRALQRLNQKRLATAKKFDSIKQSEQSQVLVLVALKRRPRVPLVLSARTGLTLAQVEATIAEAQRIGYVDGGLKLTKAGFETLGYLKTTELPRPPLLKTNKSFYCPKSLRSPRRIV